MQSLAPSSSTSVPSSIIQHQHQESQSKATSSKSSLGANKSSKLLEGVVFVLLGFINPERGTLRSQALEMGDEYEGAPSRHVFSSVMAALVYVWALEITKLRSIAALSLRLEMALMDVLDAVPEDGGLDFRDLFSLRDGGESGGYGLDGGGEGGVDRQIPIPIDGGDGGGRQSDHHNDKTNP